MATKKPRKPADDRSQGQSKVTMVGKAGTPKYGRSSSSSLRGKTVSATTTTVRGDFPSTDPDGRGRGLGQRTDTGRVRNIPQQTRQGASRISADRAAAFNSQFWDYRGNTNNRTRSASRAAAQKAMRAASAGVQTRPNPSKPSAPSRTNIPRIKPGQVPPKGRGVKTGSLFGRSNPNTRKAQ
jgi:hypothetical protein